MKTKDKLLTQDFLVKHLKEQFQLFEQKFDGKLQSLESKLESKIDWTKTFLESRIEFVRKDMREHVASTVEGAVTMFNQRIDGLDKKIDAVEMKVEALHDNVNFLRSDVKEIKNKINRHDEEIVFLKARVA